MSSMLQVKLLVGWEWERGGGGGRWVQSFNHIFCLDVHFLDFSQGEVEVTFG